MSVVDALLGGRVRAHLGGMLSQPCSLQDEEGLLDTAVTGWMACSPCFFLSYFLKLWLSRAFQYAERYQALQQRGSQDTS